MGTRTIIVEDNTNFNYGLIDTTYAQIGAEFDNTMFDILSTNFGNPLASDALTDNNGKIIMVFTHKVNDKFTGIAGFVAGCDFYPRTTRASSNVGEYFYAKASTVSGNISVSDSPPAWRWGIRSTIIHEVKHVTSFAERFSRGAAAYEESWLEETTARISEELYERARYSFTQRSNIGYGSAANSVGPYCGVRACNGQPRGIIRVFQELADKWYLAPQDYSPLGRLSLSDFSFYATGWSLVRWALDANVAQTESAILKGLIQEARLMPRVLFIEPEAEADLAEAFAWYETQQLGLGSELLAEVARALLRPRSRADFGDRGAECAARSAALEGTVRRLTELFPSPATPSSAPGLASVLCDEPPSRLMLQPSRSRAASTRRALVAGQRLMAATN